MCIFTALPAYSFLAHTILFYLVVCKRSIASKWWGMLELRLVISPAEERGCVIDIYEP